MADDRFEQLTALLSTESLGGIEGEPGWIIERRYVLENLGYESWLKGAAFRVHVNLETYSLAFPEVFCDEETFCRYVRLILGVYIARNPDRAEEISKLQKSLR